MRGGANDQVSGQAFYKRRTVYEVNHPETGLEKEASPRSGEIKKKVGTSAGHQEMPKDVKG